MSAENNNFQHSIHFNTNEQMDYAANILSTYSAFIQDEDIVTAEFDGDDVNEVYFTTPKPLTKVSIKKITTDLGGIKDFTFNY